MRLWLLSSLTLLACNTTSGNAMADKWERVPLADERFVPKAVIAQSADAALIAGSHAPGAGYPIGKHDAAIYRWTRSDGPLRVYAGEGQVIALASHQEQVWAVVTAAWKDYRLLRSDDSGASFAQAGTIPARSITGLAADDTSIWAWGVGALLRSTNRGQDWTAVPTPAPPTIKTRLQVADGSVVRYGDALSVWSSSESWKRADHAASAISEPWVTAPRDGHYALGKRGSTGIDWGIRIPDVGTPVHLFVDPQGSIVRILAVPEATSEREVHAGWYYAATTDGGQSWHQQRLPASVGEVIPPAALVEGGGFAVARDGDLWVLRRPAEK